MPVLTRLLIGAPLAALIAAILFLAMRVLIATGELEIADARDPVRVDISPDVPEPAPVERTLPEPVAAPAPPPVPVTQHHASLPTENTIAVTGAIPDFETPDIRTQTVALFVPDREVQPLVRIDAAYPARALESGLEGECLMRFDVGADGTPINVEAVSCSNGVFRTPSVRAVERWRYAPKIINGAAVTRPGVQTNIEYALEN